MRFLIVATVFACAAAAPSGSLLASHYGAPVAYASPVAVAPVAHLAPALPTISAGDINGAVIDAHVEASDHVRAAVDATRQVNDKVSELHGQAINNAEENAWRAVDNVKTVEAQLDGAAAGAAPVIAKSLARNSVVAPVSYAAAPVATYAAAPVTTYAAAPVTTYAAAPVTTYSAAPVAYSAPVAYGTPVAYGNSVAYGSPVAYGNSVAYGTPVAYGNSVAYGAPSAYATGPVTFDPSPLTSQAW